MDAVTLMAAPATMAFLMVAIHAYLGMHVLEREVIFVDIGLSQVAALGGVLGLAWTGDHEGPSALAMSLGLCLLVALALALFRAHERKISQEAIIGVTYAFASGLLILVADKLPHGTEHIKETLVGNILFVTWPDVVLVSAIYAVVGFFHFVFRRSLWACSRGENKSLLWDFAFYFLFGVVITFSTRHAGVLVVFTILVVPAAIAKSFVKKTAPALLIAWGLGVAGTAGALGLSYIFDWPAGASIVSTLAAGFFGVLLARTARAIASVPN